VIDRVDGCAMTLDVLLAFDAQLDAAEEQPQADSTAGGEVQPRQLAKQKGDEKERRADNRYIRRNSDVCSDRPERSDQD
jgi:hypothetical protein